MSLARFVAKDKYRPQATEEELADIFLEMDGVVAWNIHDNGEVTIEYDGTRVNERTIEEAIHGLGFVLIHIDDRGDVTPQEISQALSQ